MVSAKTIKNTITRAIMSIPITQLITTSSNAVSRRLKTKKRKKRSMNAHLL